MDELRQMLLEVSDTYFDFVHGIMNFASKNQTRCNQLVSYIKDHPEATSSEIIEYATFEMDLMKPQGMPYTSIISRI